VNGKRWAQDIGSIHVAALSTQKPGGAELEWLIADLTAVNPQPLISCWYPFNTGYLPLSYSSNPRENIVSETGYDTLDVS
jgi:hypothetical protein